MFAKSPDTSQRESNMINRSQGALQGHYQLHNVLKRKDRFQRRYSGGYTLLEMTLVVAILGIIASVAIPALAPARQSKLDLAATLIADAIRYSRSEALRTRQAHGVSISQITNDIRVVKFDTSTNPVSQLATLNHPISKQPHTFNVNTLSTTSGVTISNAQAPFDFKNLGARTQLIFDELGTPMWIEGAGPSTALLNSGYVQLSFGTLEAHVRVAPFTGRVTIE